jgi:hypothetical protein
MNEREIVFKKKNLENEKNMATTSKIVEPTSKSQKITLGNGYAKEFSKIEIFDFENKLIDEDTINLGNF